MYYYKPSAPAGYDINNQDQEAEPERIPENEIINHVFIEDYDGVKVKCRTYIPEN